jgi:ribosomal protein L37AE/L43A
VSNTRRLKRAPRPPDATEAAFRDELRKGCPHCKSRRVVGRFRAGVWDFGLRCEASCRTFTEPQFAHRLAAEAAERAGLATGERLQYQAFDTSTGRIEGAVRALAGR